MLWIRWRNLSVLKFLAVGKTFRALFWCAIKGGGCCPKEHICNFQGSNGAVFLAPVFHRLLYTTHQLANCAFQVVLNSEIYVDKAKLIEDINQVLDTMQNNTFYFRMTLHSFYGTGNIPIIAFLELKIYRKHLIAEYIIFLFSF